MRVRSEKVLAIFRSGGIGGVEAHTIEFPSEKLLNRVRRAVRDLGYASLESFASVAEAEAWLIQQYRVYVSNLTSSPLAREVSAMDGKKAWSA